MKGFLASQRERISQSGILLLRHDKPALLDFIAGKTRLLLKEEVAA